MAKTASMIASIALIFSLGGCGDQIGDKYVMFAKCLTRKQVRMYGTFWCPHCENQREMFGPQGFKEIAYTECDPRGEKADPVACAKAGVKGYPTWIFPDGSRIEGEVPLERLAEKSECELPG